MSGNGLPKLNILVVEDESLVAKALTVTLMRLGHVVTSIASTGEEAVERAEEEKPDLILMDIILDGEMDGIDAAKIIYSRSQIPFIYVTAHADQNTKERADLTGPYGYLIKPYKEKELAAAICEAVARYEKETEQE
jgi:CheY-like chemotaxis protein